MKRTIPISILLMFMLVVSATGLTAATYEASTLHNAVARSETVLDLFYERWARIQEMELYFDWYGKINWVHNFKVNTVNAATKEKQAVDMTLVRTYGSITINIPILGGYEGTDMKQRLKHGTGKYKNDNKQEDTGLWKPKGLILGLTATGFHYGLTRETTVNRGSAGEETITDYKYTQFFDDIFAASLLYRPYFYIHAGVILNKQYEPKDDGTMSYSDPVASSKRYFVASNMLSFLNVNASSNKGELEGYAVGIILNALLKYAVGNIDPIYPQFTFTFKSLNIFNDEPYDAVWVSKPIRDDGTTEKDSDLPDDQKDKAKLYTFSILLRENIKDYVYIDLYTEFQKPNETLYQKRNDQKKEYSKLRQFNALFGYNFLGSSVNDGIFFITSLGVSRYWDIAIPIHSNSEDKYYLWGGIFQVEGRLFAGGIPITMEMKVNKNYAPELRKLVETADKWAIEGSFNISF